mmetsp:Transcript_25883/g.64665  ORF Transcript_25883/g.64665 Transcript_25883/m.64665 type:complete len:246 (-) Transcript_25883:795-1532(-)
MPSQKHAADVASAGNFRLKSGHECLKTVNKSSRRTQRSRKSPTARPFLMSHRKGNISTSTSPTEPAPAHSPASVLLEPLGRRQPPRHHDVIKRGRKHRPQMRRHDIQPKPVLRPRDRDLPPARHGGDQPRPKVPRGVPAGLGERCVQRDEDGDGEADEEGGEGLRAGENLVARVGEGEDDEHEDAGAPGLDEEGLGDGDGARGEDVVEARVGEVFAEAGGGEDGVGFAAGDVVSGFVEFEGLVEP